MHDIPAEEITSKQVESIKVASIRFLGYPREIPQIFDRLEAAVGANAAGRPIFLHFWGHSGPEQDIEICLPVKKPIESGKVHTRVLMGGIFLTTRHRGAYEQLSAGWQRLNKAMKDHRLGWGNGPGREVYLEGPDIHETDSARYLTEIQIPLLLPEWIGHLEEGVEHFARKKAAQYVVGEGHALTYTSSAKERAVWVQGMLERLEQVIPDADHQHDVLSNCSHVFPKRRVEQLREIYQQTGELDAVVAFMCEDRSEQGNSYYESPHREGDTIRVTKIPFDARGYQAAKSSLEKKLSYCHCPMVKDALREKISLSSTYCSCGAGWYHTLWEGILERPVRVDVTRSLLNGDDTCEFAIHLA
jgi:effector-binding domain-containing protein